MNTELKSIAGIKNIPLFQQRIQNVENAKAIKVNVNSQLKPIVLESLAGLKQLIPLLPNLELKTIFLDALKYEKTFKKDIAEDDLTFAEIEKYLKSVVIGLKKYFSS